MSRSLSSDMLRDIQSQETGEVFLVLVTIHHDTLPVAIRITSDGVNTTSRGETYLPFPFEFIAPEDSEEGSTRATIRVDNVDREIVRAIRTVTSAPKITVEVVRASDPETVEVSWPDFDLLAADYNQLVVTGQIGLESYVTAPFPNDTFTPNNFPGLF